MHIQPNQVVEIVYIDKAGKVTQRKIAVLGVRDRIRATCLTTGAPCVFILANILAWQPVRGRCYA
ncbi:hypothetical protein HCB82_01190 [Paenibacillus sp. 7028]|nr:hypothetical protein [Paenibacillus apii]